MNIAAILLTIQRVPEASRKWVIQSGIVGTRFVVRVSGADCGRGRFVEARHFLTPWKCQARKFEDKADAEAFARTLQRARAQSIDVETFENAWHEEVLDDRWDGTAKIGPTNSDHDRPLLELVRLYAGALEGKLRLRHIMPAALAFIDPRRALETASPGGGEVACRKLHAWRERLQTRGLSTMVLLIVEGATAEKIASKALELGSTAIAIGAQHGNQNDLLGGWLRHPDTQALLREAPCPVLISDAPQVLLT